MPQPTVPGTTVRLLSQPSKMSCYSWSLPAAGAACPSMNGTICAGCYATKGSYRYPSTEKAQQARWQWTRESMRSAAAAAPWVQHMSNVIIHKVLLSKAPKFFRIHDSGDFFNSTYTMAWLQVIREVNSYAVTHKLEPIKFWASTRRWQAACRCPTSDSSTTPAGTHFRILSGDDRMMRALQMLAAEPHVTIRPSALDFDAVAPILPGLAAGSGSLTPTAAPVLAQICPASRNSSSCAAESCRHCWTNPSEPVYYLQH